MARAAAAVLLFPAFCAVLLVCVLAVVVAGFVGSFTDGEW